MNKLVVVIMAIAVAISLWGCQQQQPAAPAPGAAAPGTPAAPAAPAAPATPAAPAAPVGPGMVSSVSPQELGINFYPGASVTNSSRSVNGTEKHFYVDFETNVPFETVVAFYTEQLAMPPNDQSASPDSKWAHFKKDLSEKLDLRVSVNYSPSSPTTIRLERNEY